MEYGEGVLSDLWMNNALLCTIEQIGLTLEGRVRAGMDSAFIPALHVFYVEITPDRRHLGDCGILTRVLPLKGDMEEQKEVLGDLGRTWVENPGLIPVAVVAVVRGSLNRGKKEHPGGGNALPGDFLFLDGCHALGIGARIVYSIETGGDGGQSLSRIDDDLLGNFTAFPVGVLDEFFLGWKEVGGRVEGGRESLVQ